jgi:hypothetical protein
LRLLKARASVGLAQREKFLKEILMRLTMTDRLCILLLACAIGLTLMGCSDDSTNGDEPGDTRRDTAAADVSTDAVANDVADLGLDSQGNETSDTGDTGDTGDTSASNDTGDTTERDGDSPDVGKIPTGDDCHSQCTGGTLDAVACDACEDGVCFTSVDANPRNYCSRHCSRDTDCEDLGSQWRCDGVCVKEEN